MRPGSQAPGTAAPACPAGGQPGVLPRAAWLCGSLLAGESSHSYACLRVGNSWGQAQASHFRSIWRGWEATVRKGEGPAAPHLCGAPAPSYLHRYLHRSADTAGSQQPVPRLPQLGWLPVCWLGVWPEGPGISLAGASVRESRKAFYFWTFTFIITQAWAPLRKSLLQGLCLACFGSLSSCLSVALSLC